MKEEKRGTIMEKLNLVIEKNNSEKELKRAKGYVLGLRRLNKNKKEKKEAK